MGRGGREEKQQRQHTQNNQNKERNKASDNNNNERVSWVSRFNFVFEFLMLLYSWVFLFWSSIKFHCTLCWQGGVVFRRGECGGTGERGPTHRECVRFLWFVQFYVRQLSKATQTQIHTEQSVYVCFMYRHVHKNKYITATYMCRLFVAAQWPHNKSVRFVRTLESVLKL